MYVDFVTNMMVFISRTQNRKECLYERIPGWEIIFQNIQTIMVNHGTNINYQPIPITHTTHDM